MIDKLEGAFLFHQAALGLRHQRHEVLANNIANADTPNFKARDFDFAAELARAVKTGPKGGSGSALTLTSSRHIPGGAQQQPVPDLLYHTPDQPSLDGNTVEMERERVNFADNAVRYQASLTFLESRIHGLKNAMQPES